MVCFPLVPNSKINSKPLKTNNPRFTQHYKVLYLWMKHYNYDKILVKSLINWYHRYAINYKFSFFITYNR